MTFPENGCSFDKSFQNLKRIWRNCQKPKIFQKSCAKTVHSHSPSQKKKPNKKIVIFFLHEQWRVLLRIPEILVSCYVAFCCSKIHSMIYVPPKLRKIIKITSSYRLEHEWSNLTFSEKNLSQWDFACILLFTIITYKSDEYAKHNRASTSRFVEGLH